MARERHSDEDILKMLREIELKLTECNDVQPAESSKRAQTEVWAYCLMPNHVHIILVPTDEDGLRRTFADLHRRILYMRGRG